MPEINTHVAVLITCYNGQPYLDDLLTSLRECQSSDIKQTIVLVDNESTDGSGDYARDFNCDVDVVRLEPNKGFTGGNNFGLKHIQQQYSDVDYVVLLNTDTVVTEGWLNTLVDFMEFYPSAASVQPKIMLHSDPTRINTIGNRSHYLGFGMMTAYNEIDEGQYDSPTQIDFPSGCCVMIRADLLKKYSLFDDEYFMYLEDAELGWKLRIAGYENWFCPDVKIYHKYIANAPYKYYYYLERNRWLLLFTYYRIRTILLLMPMFVFMELGQGVFSITVGKFKDKLRSWFYFFKPRNVKRLGIHRKTAQLRRKISDKQFTRDAVAGIEIPSGSPFLLKYFATPIMATYWKIIYPLIK
ncbi:glycosyltransferase family 2 protein [Planctomycetota bacterium]|nr:glycosyltransferase family 2 protein [Planctomycetota bacterium]